MTVAKGVLTQRIPVILDTDIGDDIDDTWALALLLKSPELDVRLISTAARDTTYRAKIVARLLEIAGRSNVPIGIGIPNTGRETSPRQTAWVKDYVLDRYPGTVHSDGVQAIIETIMASPEPMTLIGIGPLSNVAEALRREPRIAGRTRFVGMHGSVNWSITTNLTLALIPGACAEWNVVSDVEAAQAVFAAPWLESTITPLDTCGRVVLDGAQYRQLLGSNDPLLQAVLENYRLWARTHGGNCNAESQSSVLFDCVAVHLAHTTRWLKMQRLGMRVDADGYTREDDAARPFNVALEWDDYEAYADDLVSRLVSGASDSGLTPATGVLQASIEKARPAQVVPRVNFNPGPEYGDENRYFGICSSISKTPGGRLWCGFSSGGLGESQFNYGVVVTSDDDGQTWSKPRIVFDTDGDGPIRSDHVVTWVSPAGQLWIMWSQYPQGLCGPDSSEWAITCDNPDAVTPVWTAPRKIADGQNLLNKPIVLSDGSWLFPTGCWNHGFGDAHVHDYEFPSRPLLSYDCGKTFWLGGPLIADRRPDFDEYMVVERIDGTLVAFNRANGLLEGESRDGGRNWSKLELNAIPHTAARFVFMKLQSGNWLLVKHGSLEKVDGRTRLTAFVSKDEGRFWSGGLVLDERAVSYPDGFQVADGRIFVSYERNRWNNPEILMAVFTEADVVAGHVVGAATRLKILVNKATGDKAAFRADPGNAKYLSSDGEPPV